MTKHNSAVMLAQVGIDTEWAERVSRISTSLTRSETALMEYITTSPHEAAFMSLKELCFAAKKSKPKVIEFYRKLGYENYKHFREGIISFYEHHIDSYKASTITFKKISSVEELITAAIQIDIKSLTQMAKRISTDDLLYSAQSILEAENIYLFGPGTGFYPTHFLFKRLKRYRLNVHLAGLDLQHLAEEIFPICKNDLLICFHYFPVPEIFKNIMSLARDEGAKIILITGSIYLDLANLSDRVIFINRGDIEFKNSIAVPMTFANLLLLTVELVGRDGFKNYLKELEVKREKYNLILGGRK